MATTAQVIPGDDPTYEDFVVAEGVVGPHSKMIDSRS